MAVSPHAAARIPFFVLVVACSAGRTPAQASLPLPEGFAAREVLRETAYPTGFGGFAPGARDGDLFYGQEHVVYHRDAAGLVSLVHVFPLGTRVDLLVRPPGTPWLFYAGGASAPLHVRDVITGVESTRPILPNAFDLVLTAGGDVLVSANPGWPAAGAHPGIWVLDPNGSGHREVVSLSGASGPMLVDRATGDLLYATASATFPTPPGSVRVLRFPAARIATAIAGGPTLTAADAGVFASGLDGAFDLAMDDRGTLLVSNPLDGRVERISPAGGIDPTPLVAAHGRSALGLAFEDRGAATFQPYQPAAGARLLIGTSDWATSSTVLAIETARPIASTPAGPTAGAGQLAVELRGLPPRAIAVVLFNHLPLLPTEQALLNIGGAPVWWRVDLLVPPLSATTVADATGFARLDLPYAGGLSWTLAFQAAGIAGPLVFTSTSITIRLLP